MGCSRMTHNEQRSDERLSANFRRSEFACWCGCGFDDVDPRLVQRLQHLREQLNAPIVVNSGCRCAEHNESVGGRPQSQHLLGKAADIRVPGRSPAEVKAVAESMNLFTGIGIYATFVHLDVGDVTRRWDGR